MCYRRADSEEMVDRIYDSLAAGFGEAAIFRDIDTIPPGVDFPTYVQDSLRECPVTLVFIGKEWASCIDARGRRRIDNPGDHVRIEVETALALPGARVIPVFVKRAEVPDEDELPESLRALCRRNGITIRSSGLDYKHDIAHLSKILEEAVEKVMSSRQAAAEERRGREQEAREREAVELRERELAEQRRVEEEPRHAAETQHPAVQAAFALRSLAAGQLIAGRFRLESLLGQGGMGVVWRARDEDLRKTRALKLLKEELANDAGAIASLKDEVGRCQELTHKHIIRLFDLVKDEARGLVAISMEVAEGGSLTARRSETPHRWFEPDELLPWVRQLCEALTYIHEEAGLVHRDIKPGNLLLDERGRLKLSDFGISGTLTESLSRLTGEQPSTGTPAYMSPEQAEGKPPHPSDDLYALGATLYELLTGQPPFTGSAASVRAQLLSDASPPAIAARRSMLEKVEAPVPRPWEEVIAALLSKNAADRPASAREVMDRLRASVDRSEPPHAIAAAVERFPAEKEPEASEMASSQPPQEAPSDEAVAAGLVGDPWKDYEKMETAPAEPEISRPQTEPPPPEMESGPLGAPPPKEPATARKNGKTRAGKSSSGEPAVAGSAGKFVPAAEPSRGKIREVVGALAGLALMAFTGLGIWSLRSTLAPAPTPLPRFAPPPVETPDATPAPPAATPTTATKDIPYENPLGMKLEAPKPPVKVKPLVIAIVAPRPAATGSGTPKSATKEAPFVNSLGMKFVPVEITGGPTNGKRVLFSVWDTRVQDYAEYARTKGITPAKQWQTQPVVDVSWEDAEAFCAWLSKKEGRAYRLPTDAEWSVAVGLGQENGNTPEEKLKNSTVTIFPWGAEWPPPKGSGNFLDEAAKKAQSSFGPYIGGYDDGFASTSPVGSFMPNRYGLYDMAGNVQQWCEDWYNSERKDRVLRGSAWDDGSPSELRSSYRWCRVPTFRMVYIGFRCVLVVSGE
jgi:serine/threonine protein kinase